MSMLTLRTPSDCLARPFPDSSQGLGAIWRVPILSAFAALMLVAAPIAAAAQPGASLRPETGQQATGQQITAQGTTPKAVIELFTSQGCSSCPPADATLTRLSRDPDLITLTLPVDYWDYLGWRDTLARPEFSKRQRAYAKARHDRGVFTPQMVVNGAIACVGSQDDKVAEALDAATARGRRLPVPVQIARTGNRLTITIPASPERRADILLLGVSPHEIVVIERGENKGRSASYSNVVRSITRIGEWRGEALSIEAEAPASGLRAVVLLQRPGDDAEGAMHVIGAARH